MKGELAGYALGKIGTDFLVPGALAKVASRSVKSAKELAAVCRNLKIANKTLILETAVGIRNGAEIAKVVGNAQKTAFLADELGFSARELGQLKQAGRLEETVAGAFENIVGNPVMYESFDLLHRSTEFLKPYIEIFA